MNDKRKDTKPPTTGRLPGGLVMILIALVVVILLNMLVNALTATPIQLIPYSQFITYLKEGRVDKVEIQPDRIMISLKPEASDEADAPEAAEPTPAPDNNATFMDDMLAQTERRFQAQNDLQIRQASLQCYTGRMEDPALREMLDAAGVEYAAVIPSSNILAAVLLNYLVPFLFVIGLWFLLRRTMSGIMGGGGGRGGFMSIGQSNAKVYMEKKTGVTFEDVAGQEEAKESLNEIVDFLHNPDKYTAIGAKQPKGALMVGPPGTGKTLLAKAVAGEANVVFFSLSGSDFVEMFVGVGASRVRDLFKQASQQAPCIIFIDEIDAIGKSRDNQFNSNDEREQTLNQLLAEMDGFDSSKGVVILGATNRPEILDKALLRPGRFDRRIIVERPDLKGREDILKLHAKKVKMHPSVELKKIALTTPGATGADLENMINEAALRAVRMNRQEVRQDDLMESVEVVIAGKEKKDRIMSEKEKKIVSFHEVGHAMAHALQKDATPVLKITIVPRTMGALGYNMNMPEEEKYLNSKDELMAEIIALLAGRAAERVEFDIETTGASNDIERATKMARSMVSMYGMSDKFGMMNLESIESKYLDGRSVLNCSDRTGAELDAEVGNILRNCYDKAEKLLRDNYPKLREIAAFLFNKETITGDEFMEILKAPVIDTSAVAI
jgi:cell division protease FtsH